VSAGRLGPIVERVRARLAERRRELPQSQLAASVRPDPRRAERFVAALRAPGLAVIAECKRRSPSAGQLTAETDWTERSKAYARAGAAVISVLTEADHFGGAPQHLDQARAAGLPLLRKDFLLDTSMVLESALWGADAVLLLPCILEPAQLKELFDCACELGLGCLVEVHNEAELELALELNPAVLGVNSRDLATFTTDLAVVERLFPLIPTTSLRVAESGLRDAADVARVRAAGADAVLIGEALMRSQDPETSLRGWIEAVR
jgi:indole-3-glycerol phosphate synthase